MSVWRVAREAAVARFQYHLRFLCAFAACIASLTGCTFHGRQPDLAFAWSQSDESLRAVPELKPAFAPMTRAAFLRDEDGILPLAQRPDAPNGKEWRDVRGSDKGPTVMGVNLTYDLSEHTWTSRIGLVRRGGKRGFSPQFVMSFDGL